MFLKSYKKLFAVAFFILIAAELFAAQNIFEVAYETSAYTYKEPHLDYPISLKGHKQGFSANYKRYGIWESQTLKSNFGLLEIRYMTGDNDYKGWLGDGNIFTPFDASNIRDYYFEAQIKVGQLLYQKDNFDLEGSLGFGYRFLKDHLESIGEGGYLRESNYLFLPVELAAGYQMNEYLKITLKTQFDYLLSGEQYSGAVVGDASSKSVRNKQEQGYGLRASLKLSAKAGFAQFFIEPFWRYWHIQNSEEEIRYINIGGTWYVQTTCEPFNTTQEYGLKIGIVF